MRQIMAVIFDFDGVVVDSLGAHLSAWAEASQETFGEMIPEELLRTLPGRSTHAIATLLAGHFRAPGRAEALADTKRRLLSQRDTPIALLPGAAATMQHLRSQNIPFGIASNAPRAFVRALVDQHQLPVGVALGVEDAANPKPAPDLFLACASRLGIGHIVHPSTVVFEDSLHGLRAAQDAGMYPVGLQTQHSAPELRSAGAKISFLHLADAINQGFFKSQLL